MSEFDDLIDQVAAKTLPPVSMERVTPIPGLVAHIDGDGAAYHAAGPDHMPAGQCRHNVARRVQRLKRVTGATTVVIQLTCGASTKGDRFLVAESKPYQGNRGKSKKPKNWQAARDSITDYKGNEFIVHTWKDREADDGVAYHTTATYDRKGLHVIHSDDKDFRMFAGIHVNWRTWHQTTVPKGAFEVWGEDGLLYGHKWFWYQLIQGDTADNIPGLHRQGEKAAHEALSHTTNNAEAYAACADLYASRLGEGWERVMVEQAALLWMRTDRHASVIDFLSLGVFPHNVQEAAWHMADRVRLQKQHLEELRR